MATTTNLSNLVINYLTQAQYDAAAQAGTLNENQIYLTPATPLATVATSGSYSDLSNKPTNVSSFTNDAGYLTSSDIVSVLTYKGTKATTSALPSSGNKTGDVWHVTANGGEYAWDGSAWQELGSTIDLSNYATKATTLSGYGITDAKIQNGTITLGSNTITPLISYTETDPVFAASAAAGITSTDISNWNAKVSDDKTWNGVSLTKQSTNYGDTKAYVPATNSTTTNNMTYTPYTYTPTAHAIAKYDVNARLYSTTPSANDNSTKVATTAYVDAAIPDVSGYVSKSGDTMSGNLSFASDKKVQFYYDNTHYATLEAGGYNSGSPYVVKLQLTSGGNSGVILKGVNAPEVDTDAANKKYVDDKIPQVYSSTNTNGYLTMATLPIYDGTVV